MPDDYPSNSSTTGVLQNGSSLNGSLETSGDTDWFRVSVAAGLAYQFTVTPTVSFTNSGLNETLVNEASTVVTGGPGTRTITYTPTSTATLYLIVASGSNATGNYVLSSTAADDYTADVNTSGNLIVNGTPTMGGLQTSADHDYLKVSLTAGVTYKFTVSAASTFTSSGLNERILNSNLVNVMNGDNYAYGDRSYSFSFTPTTSGLFYLDVYSGSNGTGTYTVTTTTVGLPVYRFFDKSNGTHFFTSDSAEKNNIIASLSSRYTEETNGYGAVSAADPNAAPVYRFFDTTYGTHFFTANSSERDTIQATRSDLTYEPNSTFYEHATQQSGDVAVYRFFDTQFGTHFYTGDASEFAGITTPGSASYRSNLTYEGVGFYAPAGSFK